MGEPWDRLAGLHCCHVKFCASRACGSRPTPSNRRQARISPATACLVWVGQQLHHTQAAQQVRQGAKWVTGGQVWCRGRVWHCCSKVEPSSSAQLDPLNTLASRVHVSVGHLFPPLLYYRRDRGVARHLQGRAGRAGSSTGVISRRAPQGADLGTRQESCSSDARQEACHSSEPTLL